MVCLQPFFSLFLVPRYPTTTLLWQNLGKLIYSGDLRNKSIMNTDIVNEAFSCPNSHTSIADWDTVCFKPHHKLRLITSSSYIVFELSFIRLENKFEAKASKSLEKAVEWCRSFAI